MDFDSVSVDKNAKKERGQYPAILTSRLVNNVYILNVIMVKIVTTVIIINDLKNYQ